MEADDSIDGDFLYHSLESGYLFVRRGLLRIDGELSARQTGEWVPESIGLTNDQLTNQVIKTGTQLVCNLTSDDLESRWNERRGLGPEGMRFRFGVELRRAISQGFAWRKAARSCVNVAMCS